MNDLPTLAAAYAIFLAIAALLLSSKPKTVSDWPHAELPKLRGVVARTLLVLAVVILVIATARHVAEPRSLLYVGASGLFVGGVAWRSSKRR